MPFLIGFFVAATLNPLVRFLSKRFDMKRKPCAVMILLIFHATVGMLLTIFVVRLAVGIGEFSSALPALYSDTIEPAITWMFELVNKAISHFEFSSNSSLEEGIAKLFTSLRTTMSTAVSDVSVKALTRLSAFAAGIPRFVIELVFAVIASFFFIVDYEELIGFIKTKLPRRTSAFLGDLKERFDITIKRYAKSYTIIMLITLVELLVGFYILGVGRPVVYAFLIALLDVLPVIGCGGVLIPWGIIELLRQRITLGVGILILWAVITVVRNIIEPRIVGKQVGLHPLLTLAAMFVGTKLFGVIGLFLFPIGLAIALSVWRERGHMSRKPE